MEVDSPGRAAAGIRELAGGASKGGSAVSLKDNNILVRSDYSFSCYQYPCCMSWVENNTYVFVVSLYDGVVSIMNDISCIAYELLCLFMHFAEIHYMILMDM